jgi:hypothetical protein
MAKPQAIKEGYYVAINMVPGASPQCCYIGLVKALDEYGLRINQVHWDDKLDVISPNTEDLFIPWENVESMLVCTPEQPMRRFVRDRAPQWASEIEAMLGIEKPKAKKPVK